MSDEMQTGEVVDHIPDAGEMVEQTTEEVAAPDQQPLEDQQDGAEAQPEPDRVEIAFAKRLAHEKQKLEQQYTPAMSFIQSQAQKYGLTPEQYIQEVERSEKEAERQSLLEQGIDPEFLDQVVSNNPVVQQAQALIQQQQMQQQFNAEAQELFNMFPDLTPDKVPAEVFQIKSERGLSLLDAYLRHEYPKIRDSARREGEQAALAANSAPSPGSLVGSSQPPKSSVFDLSADEFKRLQEEVLSGSRSKI